jgi:type IV pilus assembly protein PilP
MGLTLLLPGCDDSEKTIAKPQVVQKKIGAQADRIQPTSKSATAVQPPTEDPDTEARPALTQVKPEVTPAPAPQPTAPPKPQPPPPTVVPEGPAASTTVQPVVAGEVSAASLQPDGGKKASPFVSVTDANVTALLHIKAPDPYNPKGKVDPFDPLLRDETASNVVQLKPKKRAQSTPLENIEIGQLKLVAIIGSASGKLAMVQESSGKGYIIRPGTYIGTNAGKVLSIEADKVLFEEEYEDVHGKTITKKKEMTLPKPPGEL